MAQPFQSGSPYGAPYAAGSYYPTYQQFPSQPPSSSPPFVQQNTRPNGGYQSSPNLNMGRFDSNSQAAAPPPQNFSFAAAPYNHDMFKQFANASIHPPPPPNFPPVPISTLGFPQFAQNFPPSNQTQFQQPQTERTIPDASDSYDPRFPQQLSYSTRTGPTFPPPQESQTEGQRKEVDNTSSRTMSQEEYAQESFEPFGRNLYPSNFDGSVFSTQRQPQEYSRPDSTSINPQSSIFATGPPHDAHIQQLPGYTEHVSTSGSKETLTPPQQTVPAAAHVKLSSGKEATPPNERPMIRKYESKTPSDLRQLAKGALLSLVPHRILYPELVKEGVSESVLQQLYEELGINLEVQDVARPPQIDVESKQQVASASNQEPPSTTAPLANNRAPQLPTPAVEASAARPPPAVSPSLERKDRIAQLLAAKTGRPSPVRSFSESGASTGPAEIRVADENIPIMFKPDEVTASQTQAEAVSEGAKQAEALKQKIERLQSQALGKVQSESKNANGAGLQISTEASNQNAGPLSSIPGLFMTSADLARMENPFAASLSAQFEVVDATRSSQKRSLEIDSRQSDLGPSAKRRNTDTTDAMEIDPSSEEDGASEGEIIDQGEGRPVLLEKQSTTPAAPALLTSVNNTAVTLPGSSPSASNQNRTLANQTKTRLTSAQIAEKAEMLKARFLKQRAERQKALQDGLPGLDAEVQETGSRLTQQQSQLSEVKLQISRLEAELLEARAQERSLHEEIAGLEKQLKEGVSGQKHYTDELRKLSSEPAVPEKAADATLIESSTRPLVEAAVAVIPPLSITGGQEPIVVDHPYSATQSSPGDGVEEVSAAFVNDKGLAGTPFDGTADIPSVDDIPMADETTAPPEDVGNATDGEVPESLLATAATGKDGPPHFEEMTGEYEEDGAIDEDSEGSASMSDSGADSEEEEEGEYEPDEADPSHPMDLEGSEEGEYDPEGIIAEDVSPIDQDVEEVANDEQEAVAVDSMERPQSPDSQMSEDMVGSPPAGVSDVAIPERVDDAYEPPDVLFEKPKEEDATDHSSQKLSGDNAPSSRTQPWHSHANDTVVSQTTQQEPLTNSTTPNGTSTTYHPYKSPLSSFQSFRYNEHFSKAPPTTGFRSLTYSNNIDPKVPLCPTELSGGVCEDSTCEEQHFRYLGLSDDKILVSLSSATGLEEPVRKEYLLSLKRVIADLRKDGVNEFEGVANALSAHRRAFFKEKLEGEEA